MSVRRAFGVFILQVMLALVVNGSTPCSFPSYLRARSRWEAQLSLERRAIGAFWSFNEKEMETIDLTKSEQVPTVYTCARQSGDDGFVVSFNSAVNKRTEFICLKFIQRSPFVVQVMRSKNSMTSDNSNICADSSLIMDPSPLIWPQLDQFIPSPINFVGGFQFTLTDHASGFDLCQTATLLPTWEAQCMPTDAISIDFRQFPCRGDLGMDLTQKLYNLGSWEQGDHVFALITDLNELWPRIWLLRSALAPANPNSFDIDIFSSVVITEAPYLPDSSFHYTFRMKRLSYTSQCKDEAQSCGTCNSNGINTNCLQSCQPKECTKLATQPPCSFQDTTLGEWMELSYTGSRSINVSSQSIQVQSQRARSCVDLKTDVWFEDGAKRTVLTLFDNGCKPRYQCAQLQQRSDSVLQFQLGDVTVWPQPLPLNPGQLCSTNKFDAVKLSAVQNELHPFRWRALIKSSIQNSDPSSVACGLPGRLYLRIHKSDQQTCLGSIDTCKGNPNQFDFTQGSQCSSFLATSHSCIASFTNEENGDKVVITHSVKSQTNSVEGTTVLPTTSEYLCWVFHKGEWDPSPRVYVTQAADCHSEIANDIAYRNFTGFLAQIDLAAGPGPLGSYQCSANTDNPFASITTKMQVSTPHSQKSTGGGSQNLAASVLLVFIGWFTFSGICKELLPII